MASAAADEPSQPDAERLPSVVVGIGASAGGISALRAFFANARPDTGAAFVVILHLSPDHDSRLAEVLQGATTMPVTQVRDRVQLQPDHVYVIPPNGNLVMEGLRTLDDVAYVRFASVYRNFREAKDFEEVLGELSGDDDRST